MWCGPEKELPTTVSTGLPIYYLFFFSLRKVLPVLLSLISKGPCTAAASTPCSTCIYFLDIQKSFIATSFLN